MSEYRIEAAPAVAADIEAAFEWYKHEEPDLGFEFLDELRDAYKRIVDGPQSIRCSGGDQTTISEALSVRDLLLSRG